MSMRKFLYDFKICRLLGEGTFGKVYMIKNLKDDKFYALKVISRENTDVHYTTLR